MYVTEYYNYVGIRNFETDCHACCTLLSYNVLIVYHKHHARISKTSFAEEPQYRVIHRYRYSIRYNYCVVLNYQVGTNNYYDIFFF